MSLTQENPCIKTKQASKKWVFIFDDNKNTKVYSSIFYKIHVIEEKQSSKKRLIKTNINGRMFKFFILSTI